MYSSQMRRGLLVLVTVLVLGIFVPRALAQEESRQQTISAETSYATANSSNPIDPIVEQALDEAVPDSLRSKVLIWTVSCSLFAALCSFLGKQHDWQRVASTHSCSHCVRIHSIAGMSSLLCDAFSTAGLFYIAALPYVSAIKAQPDKLKAVGIGTLLFIAFCLVLVVSGAVFRLFLPKHKFHGKRSLAPYNCFQVGQRFVGFVLTLLILDNGFTAEAVADNFTSLLGLHLGERLLSAIGVVPIRDSAVIVMVSVCASFFFRWIFPSLCQSRPLASSRWQGHPYLSSEVAKS